MKQFTKSCLVITSILLVSIPLAGAENLDDDSIEELTSTISDGIWVNQTLSIDGSTTINPQNANWVLYDRTNSNTDWPVVLSGDYFTSVFPISEGLWNWTLNIDVIGLNCTCWLEIGQPSEGGEKFLNRTIFIGAGPHSPAVLANHGNSIVVDGPEEISFRAVFSDSLPQESTLTLDWCLAPNGACVGQTSTTQQNVSWNEDIGSIEISASEFELSDGIWKFTYTIQDMYLRTSPQTELTVFVDQSNPISVLIGPDSGEEGELLLIDGSGSTDVEGSIVQAVWYVTGPDGVTYVPPSTGSSEGIQLLYLTLNESGNHTIRLDVIDWVGRMNSSIITLQIDNVAPSLGMGVKGSDVIDPLSWQIFEDEALELIPSIHDTGSDVSTISYEWLLDGEIIANTPNLSLENLEEGEYQITLKIEDDDGATDSYQIEVIVREDKEIIPSQLNIGAIVVLLGIIGFSVMMFRRMKSTENKGISLPKWTDTSKLKLTDSPDFADDENKMWD